MRSPAGTASLVAPLTGTIDFDLQAAECGAGPPDDFRGPQALAQYRQKAVLEVADGAEQIASKLSMVGVYATLRQRSLHCGIAGDSRTAGAHTERLVRKPLA
jgi:hypothetical protein